MALKRRKIDRQTDRQQAELYVSEVFIFLKLEEPGDLDMSRGRTRNVWVEGY